MTLNELTNILTKILAECRTEQLKRSDGIYERVASFIEQLECEIKDARRIVEEWKEDNYTVNAIEAEGF